MEEITFRPITQKDIEDYIPIHEEIFRLKRDLKLGFKLAKWFSEAKGIGYAARCAGRLVGIYAVIPLEVMVESRKKLFQEVISIAVVEGFRKRGIFQELGRRTFRDIGPLEDKSAIMVFPSKPSLKTQCNHLSSRLILRMRRYVKPLNFYALTYEKKRPFLLKVFLFGVSLLLTPLAGLKNWTKKRPLVGLQLKRIDKIPDDYEAFWEEANKKYPIAVVRSREFLQWRFFEEPQGANEFYEARLENELVGYCVVRLRHKNLDIVDFFCIRKENIISGIFYEIARLACKRGAWRLCMRIHDSYLENLLAEEKFTVDDSRAMILVNTDSNDAEFLRLLDKAEFWYITDNSVLLG